MTVSNGYARAVWLGLTLLGSACSPASSVPSDLGVASPDLAETVLTDASAVLDAAVSDAPAAAIAIGAAALAQRIYSTGPATGTLTTGPVTTQPGSLLLASAARGTWSASPGAPTDSYGNAFALAGATHSYADWPTSQTGLYGIAAATGGANHTFSLAWGDIGGTGDEISLSVVEVRGATSIESSSWVERAAASSITSASVTTKGPAMLVAWWWGSGGVRPMGALHVAVPGDGFTILPAATGLESLSSNGYIQVAVAYRAVAAAGTYSVTWTTDSEGAQLYLVAVR
jgi:hypothetical protein